MEERILSLASDEFGRTMEIHLEMEDDCALLEIKTREQDVFQHSERIIPAGWVLSMAQFLAPWGVPGDLESREPVCQRFVGPRLGIAVVPFSAEHVWLHVYFILPKPCCDNVEHNPEFVMGVTREDMAKLGLFFTDAACGLFMEDLQHASDA